MSRLRDIMVFASLLAWPAAAEACPVCFGAPGTQDTGALTVAIGLLLGILAVVLSGIVAFIIYLRRHSRDAAGIAWETAPR